MTEPNPLTEAEDDFDVDEDDEPVVEMTPDSLGGSPVVRSRDDALDGGLPLLMLHRGANHWTVLVPLMQELHSSSAASVSVGAVIMLPRVQPAAASQWLADCTKASVLIADPEAYWREDMWGPVLHAERNPPPKPGQPTKAPMPKTAQKWGYWTRSLPSGPDAAWISELIETQRDLGANLLLTPGVPLDAVSPDTSLAALEQHIQWANAALTAGDRLAVNVTAEATWLANPRLRAKLMNFVVESDENTWYVRVKWPQTQITYGQLVDGNVLDGYQELAGFMEDEERVLLLPNSGGTGWVSLAWGAAGFGTGIGSASRSFTTGRVIRMKKPPPRTPRYFERSLLHTIEKATADRVARVPGHASCTCRYCVQLRAAPTWDYGLSGAHYLLTVGELTAALGGNRRRAARRIVRDAERYVATVSSRVPLTDADAPAHLPAWVARLR